MKKIILIIIALVILKRLINCKTSPETIFSEKTTIIADPSKTIDEVIIIQEPEKDIWDLNIPKSTPATKTESLIFETFDLPTSFNNA